jgi:hypothetical protein
MEVFTTMIIISRFSTGLQGTGARVPPLLKAALVSVGLWLMGSRWTGRRWWSVAGARGLVIPLRDCQGRIIGLKVRSDEKDSDQKYTAVSSTKYGGPGPGAPVHVPQHAGMSLEVIRVTEGELKAGVATVLTGVLTIAIPGVSAWRAAVPVLEQLEPRTIWLAFDADWRTNPVVARALAATATALTIQGWSVMVEVWDPAQGKGIDDVVAAGHRPVLRDPALAFGLGVRAQARLYLGRLPTIAAEEVARWRA